MATVAKCMIDGTLQKKVSLSFKTISENERSEGSIGLTSIVFILFFSYILETLFDAINLVRKNKKIDRKLRVDFRVHFSLVSHQR